MAPSKNWEDFKKIPLHMGTLIHYKLAFERADKDHNGRIDVFELGEWAQSLGLRNLTFEDLKRMISEVDTNHDGRVDFWEFLAIQLYITMNLSGSVDLHEFVKFLSQSFTP
jgi:5-hydroxyisourate hydrolase-like protein (transthyretin family)|eukprot:CAMPEP_0174297288 /NCGR_PEP_ID=MMETSP0809-20121228/50580_1 /TAXON_ID=73025 ORGANISM="Eutreptiella gymnastica-like, Strain CCMP1594" /NCGR_SAMPLE_ID=MMETSP0809 /ASSEMBLY_ACC=CAM_ASM_000658 /LENGTH=110 /DNA_ID=CAMNT_0015400977 /DNA_START=42 /DNA_END=374 /DNA_ORIENTATION=-